jgi:hypothetical protein
MYVILKTVVDDIEQFVIYNKISHSVVATYSTYAEAFKDLLSR